MTAYVAGGALLLWHLGPSALEWTWWGTSQLVGGAYWLLLGGRHDARRRAVERQQMQAAIAEELHLARVTSSGRIVLADEEYRDVDEGGGGGDVAETAIE